MTVDEALIVVRETISNHIGFNKFVEAAGALANEIEQLKAKLARYEAFFAAIVRAGGCDSGGCQDAEPLCGTCPVCDAAQAVRDFKVTP